MKMQADDPQHKMLMQADDGTGSSQVTIPVEADFLYVYSTADGLYLTSSDLL